jgi:YegS/Rv2252/BmrU family lipid kinase
MLFIMNPRAGQCKAAKYLSRIIALFNQADFEVTVYMTSGPGHATEIARDRSAGMDVVVCCGGDGTFNETVAGVVESGVKVSMGYIPAGSTNDFASGLGLPADIMKAAQMIVDGKPTSYDIGRFGNRYFAYTASFGIFTKTSYSTPQSMKNTLGYLAYILESVHELSQIRKEYLRLETAEGEIFEDDFIFGALCNATKVGGVLHLDDQIVDLTDGKFEMLLVRYPKKLSEVTECIRALRKQDYSSRMVVLRSTAGVTVTAAQGMSWTLDGEWGDSPMQVHASCINCGIQLLRED